MVDHTISVHTEDGVWLIGTVDEYPFQAKICDEASGFGIYLGRVIKLYACGKKSRQEIFSYERGWDRYPKGAHKGLCQALVRFCESLPAQDVWRNTFREERYFLITEEDVLEFDKNGNPC